MDQLGRYTLIKKLATGGMAEVFLARAEGPGGFSKSLVVKRILPHLAERPTFREMFLSEARVAAQLSHPNIAQVFDFGEAQGTYFLAMELVDGPDLRDLNKMFRLLDRPLPLAACAKLLSQACEGLGWAHDFRDPVSKVPLKLVHRDISPDNLLLDSSGTVKIVDFGIVKTETQTHKTRSGTLKGKLAYMPPEQLRQGHIDKRCDVFALGVVLYELIAGAVPVNTTSEVSIIQAMLSNEPLPELRDRVAKVPDALAHIVNRALEKDPDKRYPDCQSMQHDLDRYVESTGERWPASELAKLVRKYQSFDEVTDPGGGGTHGESTGGEEESFSETLVRRDAKTEVGEAFSEVRPGPPVPTGQQPAHVPVPSRQPVHATPEALLPTGQAPAQAAPPLAANSPSPPVRTPGAGSLAVPASGPRYVVPAPITKLWGRETDLSALLERFDGGTRLITLLGPGGTGKTRLSLAVCEAMAKRVQHGVVFVELEPLAAANQVLPAIATALGLSEDRGKTVEQSLTAELKDKSLLLALDNFEHVIAAAPQIGNLLKQAPGLRALVTSRIPLKQQGEHTFPLEPLPAPSLTATLSEAELLDNPAAALFLERARTHRPKLQLTREDAKAIATICAQLDGVPLALELAAARLKMLSPRELAQRLTTGAGVLSELKSAREVSTRRRSLQEVVGFSVGLLDETARRHFTWMAVTQGSFSLADAVALGAPLQFSEEDTSRHLEALTDAGLLRVFSEADGETRFDLFVAVREHALELLRKAGEEQGARQALALRLLEVGVAAEEEMKGGGQASLRARLERDYHQLRAAIDWLLASQPVDALRLTAGVWRFFLVSARLKEGNDWLSRALEAAGDDADLELRNKGYAARGYLLWELGEHDEAVFAYEHALSLARARNDRKQIALYTYYLGYCRAAVGQFAEADALLHESAALSRADKDADTLRGAVGALGESLRLQRKELEALKFLKEAHQLQVKSQDTRGIGVIQSLLCLTHVQLKDAKNALKHGRDAVAQHGKIANIAQLPLTMTALARAELLSKTPEADERAGWLVAASEELMEVHNLHPDPIDARDIQLAIDEVKERLGDGYGAVESRARPAGWRAALEHCGIQIPD